MLISIISFLTSGSINVSSIKNIACNFQDNVNQYWILNKLSDLINHFMKEWIMKNNTYNIV